MCWGWYVVHKEVEKGWREYRPLRHSIGLASLRGWCAVVDSVGVSTCKEVRQPLLVVYARFAMFIFCMSSVLGFVSKALLMFILARSVRCAGLSASRPSCMCCVSVVRNECCCEVFSSKAVLGV